MRGLLPALTQFYGLRPWELDEMFPVEIDAYLDHLEATMRHRQSRDAR